MSPNSHKFRELLLFICHRSEGDKPFGAVKLNKLLFYSDFLAFLKFGEPITGHRYQKLRNGPAPRALLPVLQELEDADAVATAEHDYYGRPQKRTCALRDADLNAFTAEEIALVTEIIDECWGKNATHMSLMSHRFVGWKLAEVGEDIPYEVSAVKFETPSDADLEHLPSETIESIKALAPDGPPT